MQYFMFAIICRLMTPIFFKGFLWIFWGRWTWIFHKDNGNTVSSAISGWQAAAVRPCKRNQCTSDIKCSTR